MAKPSSELFDIVRLGGKGVVVGLTGLEQLEVGGRVGDAVDKARHRRRTEVEVRVGVEADLLPRHVLVVNIGAVAERLAVEGAHAVELAALIVFAVVSPRQHRAADQLQRSRARLGGDDLNGAIVDHLQAADVGGGAVLYSAPPWMCAGVISVSPS